MAFTGYLPGYPCIYVGDDGGGGDDGGNDGGGGCDLDPCNPINTCPNFTCNPPNGNPSGGNNNPPGGGGPGGNGPGGPGGGGPGGGGPGGGGPSGGGPSGGGGSNPPIGGDTPCPGNLDSTFYFPPYTNYDNPCVAQMVNLALQNALNAYNQYIDSLTSAFAERYTRHCLQALEHFSYQYVDKEYQHTLYYYDQAGNLIKTVPPEGVEYLPITSYTDLLAQKINSDRTNGQQTVFTNHRMATKYKYNSLNQLISQSVPDHDKVEFCYGINPAGLDTGLVINSIQFVNPSKGFLCGEIIQNGVSNRGYVYTTNDGGETWTRLNGMSAANFRKVQYVNSNIGYAVGDFGMVFKTTDGGSTWDLLTGLYNATGGSRYVDILNDLYFTSPNDGIVGGIQKASADAIYYTTDGGDNFAPVSSISGIAIGDTITGFAYDGTTYIATAKNGDIGKIFSSTDGLNWSKDSVVANNLKRVQYISSSLAYAVGEEGTLMKLNQPVSGNNAVFQLVPTGMLGDIIDVYFKNATDGVAIIDSVPGKGKIYKTFDGGKTWAQLSADGEYYNTLKLYDASNHKLIAGGNNGHIARVLLSSPPFGIIKVPAANSNNVSFVDASDNGSGDVTAIAVSNVSDEIYTCYDAQNSFPAWLSVQSSASIPVNDAKFKKVVLLVSAPSSPDIKGILLTATGKLYAFSRLYNSTSMVFSAVTGVPGGAFFNDITASDHSFGASIYAFNTVNNQNYQIVFSGISANATALNNSNAMVQSVNAIDLVDGGNSMIMVGNKGHIECTANMAATTTWADVSLRSVPVGVSKAEAVTTDNFIAVGNDGAVWKTYTNYGATGYRRWELVNSGTVENLNAVAVDNAGDGFVVGDNGSAYVLSNAQAMNPTLADFASGVSADLTDVALWPNGAAYITAKSGQVLHTSNYASNLPVLAASVVSSPLNGVAFNNAGMATVVGNDVMMANYFGTNAMVTKEVFTKALISTSFFDANNGYVIDDENVIRKTSDGGLSWQVILPVQGEKITKVAATQANAGTIVGLNSFVANINGTALTSIPGVPAGIDLYDISYDAPKTNGFIVGEGTRAYKITGGVISTIGQALAGTADFRAVHTFNGNSFIAAGSQGVVYYYNNSAYTQQMNYTAPAGLTQNNITFKDLYFNDNQTGYMVGDNSASFNISLITDISNVGGTTNSLPWKPLCVVGVKMNYTTSNELQGLDFRTISCSGSNYVLIGGADHNISIGGHSPNRYMRLLQEESGNNALPITKFWYDKLGRLILSQNPKQFNKVNPADPSVTRAYSYTLYDALGRITEVGEKFENHGVGEPQHSSIFGSNVNGKMNLNAIDEIKFINWIAGSGQRSEVTKTYYDEQNILPGGYTQENLRNRVASVTYEDVFDGNDMTYEHATHYSYDVHGNVKTLWQENKNVGVSGESIKQVDYEYDLISGKVNKVIYSPGGLDQFIHRYSYDADNRLTKVETSQDGLVYATDAKYFYYAHGPLARIEYGKAQVQGVDFAYTLQGWVKGVNSNIMKKRNDIGRDGDASGPNPHAGFARDIFGYTLNYYEGDYEAIDFTTWNTASTRFEAYRQNSDLASNSSSLFNGNINSMVTTISKVDTGSTGKLINYYGMPMGHSYRYDQLNRIKRSWSYNNIDIAANAWENTNATSGLYRNTFSYDANGNILTQVRRDSVGGLMDSLIYNYERDGNGELVRNRLYHVNDLVVGTPAYLQDITDQGLFSSSNINTNNNYGYDEIGNLVRDDAEQIESIEWTVSGKIRRITRTIGSPKKNLVFDYDASGNRVAKHVYTSSNQWERSSYYLRDAQGNVMSVYEKTSDPQTQTLSYRQSEAHIYGSSRLGMLHPNFEMIGAVAPTDDTTKYYLGRKSYELSNHLGNVLATISDKKVRGFEEIVNNQFDSGIEGWDPWWTSNSGGQLMFNNSSQYSGLSKDIVTVPGKTYKVRFKVTYPAGRVIMGEVYEKPNFSHLGYHLITQNGYQEFSFRAKSTLSWVRVFLADNLGMITFYLDDFVVSEEEVFPEMLSSADYYAFGQPMPGRQYNAGDYRYGFNGKENDNEVKGTGNSLDFGARMYDSRLGRWLSLDPQSGRYPDKSPYCFVGNMPIIAIDPDGEKIVIVGTAEYQQKAFTQLQKLSSEKLVLMLDGTVMKANSLPKDISPFAIRAVGEPVASNFVTKDSKPVGSKLVGDLIGKEKVVTIVDPGAGTGNEADATNWADAQNGKGSDAIVGFDPTSNPDIPTVDPKTGLVTDQKRPNQVGLAHELIHADHITNGDVDLKADRYQYNTPRGPVRQDVRSEELRTVGLKNNKPDDKTENQIRKEQNQKKRGGY